MTDSNPAPSEQSSLVDSLERLGLFGAVLAGLFGLVVAIFCFFVPGLHFILGPFGPFLGGLVGGRLSGGRFVRILVAVAIMATGMATLATAFTGLAFREEVESGLARAAPFIVFAYTAFFGVIGGGVGMLLGGGTGPPPRSDSGGSRVA